jgi:hypothetical protein
MPKAKLTIWLAIFLLCSFHNYHRYISLQHRSSRPNCREPGFACLETTAVRYRHSVMASFGSNDDPPYHYNTNITTAVPNCPVTYRRQPAVGAAGLLPKAGVSRANIVVSAEKPGGSTEWSLKHKDYVSTDNSPRRSHDSQYRHAGDPAD